MSCLHNVYIQKLHIPYQKQQFLNYQKYSLPLKKVIL